MNEVEQVIEILQKHQSVTAMLAPSFPICFSPKMIVRKLKRTGFTRVAEVAVGAGITNSTLIGALKRDMTARFITSPCPSIVRMIRTKFPQALAFLAMQVNSPMVATAKMVEKKYPDDRIVFIGPCNTKKLEAIEEHPELGIICLTYRELEKIFDILGIKDETDDVDSKFDDENKETRLYPISGGLAQSSEVSEILTDTEVEVVSGWQNAEAAVKRFLDSPQIRLLDVLFCEGGCINGPGIDSPLSMTERREKVTDHWLGEK